MALSMFRVTAVITSKLFKLDKSRVTLYWEVFKYKMSVDIINIHYFRRAKNHEQFRDELANLIDNKWTLDVKLENCDLIDQFISWRQTLPTDGSIKIAIQHDRLAVYSNTLNLFQTLIDALDEYGDETSKLLIKYTYAKQMGNYERGVLYQKNPQHKFRIYLSSDRRDPQQIAEFKSALERYEVYPSKSLQNWFDRPPKSSFMWGGSGSWTWNHYCFDFDDESLATLFLLSHEDWIGKVCRIEKR